SRLSSGWIKPLSAGAAGRAVASLPPCGAAASGRKGRQTLTTQIFEVVDAVGSGKWVCLVSAQTGTLAVALDTAAPRQRYADAVRAFFVSGIARSVPTRN